MEIIVESIHSWSEVGNTALQSEYSNTMSKSELCTCITYNQISTEALENAGYVLTTKQHKYKYLT